MVWGFCVYFVYMIPLETDVLRKHRFQKTVQDSLMALIIFQRSSFNKLLIIKSLAITLMYCNRLHAWWLTQSWLATLLSSLIAR